MELLFPLWGGKIQAPLKTSKKLAWEATLPLVSPRSDVCEMSTNPDLGSASDWLRQISLSAGPIRSTTQILVVTHHQYGISVLISRTSFHKETSADVAKGWRLLSHATCTCVPVFQATTVCFSLVVFLILQGGDADTNGAVAGALLGCKLGSSALPPTWLKGLKHKGWLDGHVTK